MKKILILKEFDVADTIECDHDPAAPPHPAYLIEVGIFEHSEPMKVCSLDAVARPDVLEAPAPAEPEVPGVPS